MPRAQINDLHLEFEEFGSRDNPTILLVMGLGTQMIGWNEPFCNYLVEHGFHVVRYDNRDIGLSDKLHNKKPPKLVSQALFRRLGIKLKTPYELRDMADDAIGLLDHLGIEEAHLVGASMGGMISQIATADFPGRVKSLTCIMSSTNNPKLPSGDRQATKLVISSPPKNDPETIFKHRCKIHRAISSPGFEITDDEIQQKVKLGLERAPYYRAGIERQIAAIIASHDLRPYTRRIARPTLVIHGTHDPLLPTTSGEDIARHARDSRLEIIDGMGHDLPLALNEKLTSLISEHAKSSHS